jgi:DNA polymerase III subunit epsilon
VLHPASREALKVREITLAALDFESAGERPDEAGVPIQIGIAAMESLEPREDSFFRSYLNPGRPVTWAARKVHGIDDAHLEWAPSLLSLWPEIRSRLTGRWVVAHGAGTEKRFLRAFPGHGFGPWVDTLTLSRKIVPGRPSYALADLCGALGLVDEAVSLLPGFRWHEALSDALASLLLLRRLVQLAEITDHPAEILIS